MSNRAAKFVSAIFASLLAGAPFTTISHSATAECLTAPKGQTPEGSHWYYRIEHPSERHCWYLRKGDDQAAQLATPNPAPAAKPPLPKTQPGMQRSVADAHAELTQDTGATIGQRNPAPAPDAASTDTVPANPGMASPQAPVEASVITSRWPALSDMSAPISPQPAAAVASPPPAAAVAVANVPSKAAAPSAAAAVKLVTADSTSKSEFGSIQMLLTIVMGALSLAAVMGGAIFKFGSTRSIAIPETRVPRRVNWGSSSTGSLGQSAYTHPRMPEGDSARDPRAADDPNRRIKEMLARLSRSAAA
jgi:hypothetical protein